jgi:histone deacetylase 1/2
VAKPLAADQAQLWRWVVVWTAACPLPIVLQFQSHSSPLFPASQQPSAHLAVGNVFAVTWFPDTGANKHVTPDLGSLTDSAPYLGNDYLHVGDGKGLDISHVGYTTLHSPKRMFTLSNVLHVPHITKLLLSVQKFYRDNHIYFEFHTSIFYVKDLITKEFLLFGQSHNGLYVLSESSATSVPQAFWSPCISAIADLWHSLLGHPTPRILNFLVSENKIVCTSRRSFTQCQACPLGKSSRLSLRPTGHKTFAPLDLIFSDVWGPAPMLSSDGFLYFVIFIDAHTKHIWYYPLVAKSDVFSTFQCFQTPVERQFSLKIKSVQTDWGGEYRKLNNFFQTIGIHHRLICPHTHEQNGIIERRHRHIVETGLTLLGQCSAPLQFWNYAFESSVYLINRMPTFVLQNTSPFECLFRRTPDYNFLRTFGCLCFPFLRPYHTHKLDFWSYSCVFLGYSSSHLVYRCLDLESHRIYVSRHVCFHENIFPFTKSEQVTSSPVPPTPPTYLPSLNPPPSFQPTTYQTGPNHNPILPSAAPHQTTPLPIDSTTPSSPSHTAILSPYACLSNDHCAGTGSPSPDAHVLRSVATEQPGSAADNPGSAAASPASAVPTSPSTASPAGL